MHIKPRLIIAIAFLFSAQLTHSQIKAWEKTEVWEPVPVKIEAKNDSMTSQAPSDAIILFNGEGLDAWVDKEGKPANWHADAYAMEVATETGDIYSKQSFCDVQLHLEFQTAIEPDKTGQAKGNSGVFLQTFYEVQILDNYTNTTYANGQVGSVYKQAIPLVNPSRPAGEWQSYDMIYTAPRFDNDNLISPAYLTVLLNGVLIQNHIELKGKTKFIGLPNYTAHGCLPIMLQSHGSPNRYRNIWIREL